MQKNFTLSVLNIIQPPSLLFCRKNGENKRRTVMQKNFTLSVLNIIQPQYQILAFYFDILINSSACFNVNSVISDPDNILAISLIFCFSSNSFNEVSVLPSLTDFEI